MVNLIGTRNPGHIPADFNKLWDNIKDHVEDVTEWAINEAPDLTLKKILEDETIVKSFNYFKQFHRAGLWGIAI